MALVYAGQVDWTGVGNHSWTAGFAVTFGQVIAIGGGGSGFRDNDTPKPEDGTNGDGGGGGGGGYASSDVSLTPGSTYTITVGGGGAAPGVKSSNNGASSTFSGPGAFVSGVGGSGGGDQYGGAGGAPGGSPGQGDGGKVPGGNRSGGGAGGAPSGGANGGGWGRTLDGGQTTPSGRTGAAYGGGGAGNKDKSDAGSGGQGAVRLKYYYSSPEITGFQSNDYDLNEGQTATLTWVTKYANGFTLNGSGVGSSSAVVTPSVSSGCSSSSTYNLNVTGPGGSASASLSINVYKIPTIDSFTISNSSPLSGDSVTISWTTTCASTIELSGSSGAFGGSSPSSSLGADSSFTFTAGTGGYYTAKLTVYNANGYKVESGVMNFTVRDETPNAFGWTTVDDQIPDQQQESNSISINGFAPTQFVDNKLPIKSNYPIQVMVNGDGIWRDVQTI